ncbi:MAG: hypothetical protein WCD53_30240 [Microcoleus sp.]
MPVQPEDNISLTFNYISKQANKIVAELSKHQDIENSRSKAIEAEFEPLTIENI